MAGRKNRVEADGPRSNPEFRLFGRNQIELARRLFVKQGAFLLISAAPVFVSSRHSQEVARADALLARFVLVEICTLYPDNPHIIGVGMYASIVSRHKLAECTVGTGGGIAPNGRRGDASPAALHFAVICITGGNEGDLVTLRLSLKLSNGPGRHHPQSHYNHQ